MTALCAKAAGSSGGFLFVCLVNRNNLSREAFSLLLLRR